MALLLACGMWLGCSTAGKYWLCVAEGMRGLPWLHKLLAAAAEQLPGCASSITVWCGDDCRSCAQQMPGTHCWCPQPHDACAVQDLLTPTSCPLPSSPTS